MFKLTLCSLALLLGTGGAACAQQEASSALAMPGAYTLGAGDIISVQVINFPELTIAQVTVPPDGKISVPLLGTIPVAGYTPEKVAGILTRRWNGYVVNPSVSVSLVQKRKETVQIYGFVVRPDTVEYQPGLHVVEAVAKVGGPGPEGDMSAVTVTHRGGRHQVVDLSHPETKSGTVQDLVVEPSDVIYIPQRHTQVSILGQVAKPGSLPYAENMTVLDALGGVGGVTETADLSDATILHNGQERKLDLNALLHGGQMSANAILTPGDSILVPELHNRTYVFGAVAKPGYYAFSPGDRVLDALNGSGGPLQTADLAKVNVIHIARDKASATTQSVDISKFLTKGDMQANVALGVGDVVFVPDKKARTSVLGVLNGVGLLATTARILGLGL